MRNKHHISFPRSPRIERELSDLGFTIDPLIVVVVVYEDDPRWPAVKALVRHYKGLDTCESEFDEADLATADLIEMWCQWKQGYPQPDGQLYQYIHQSYDTSAFCPKCGTGAIQDKPLEIAFSPQWPKTRNIFTVNWVHDAFFVPAVLGEDLRQRFHISYWPVVNYRTKTIIPGTVQLKIEHTLTGNMVLESNNYTMCQKCHRIKYDPVRSGVVRTTGLLGEHVHIAHSQEFFGAGGEAYRETFISQALYQYCVDRKIQPIAFAPVMQCEEALDIAIRNTNSKWRLPWKRS